MAGLKIFKKSRPKKSWNQINQFHEFFLIFSKKKNPWNLFISFYEFFCLSCYQFLEILKPVMPSQWKFILKLLKTNIAGMCEFFYNISGIVDKLWFQNFHNEFYCYTVRKLEWKKIPWKHEFYTDFILIQ